MLAKSNGSDVADAQLGAGNYDEVGVGLGGNAGKPLNQRLGGKES